MAEIATLLAKGLAKFATRLAIIAGGLSLLLKSVPDPNAGSAHEKRMIVVHNKRQENPPNVRGRQSVQIPLARRR